MLQVKTHLKEVEGKGIGLFASERLPMGTVWHKDEQEFDKKYSRQWVEENKMTDFFHHYANYEKESDTFYLCSDNARFVNHSEKPNTFYDADKGHCVATNDIEIGEEITCDYRNICNYDRDNGLSFEVR
jgi:SET domain-containing protein